MCRVLSSLCTESVEPKEGTQCSVLSFNFISLSLVQGEIAEGYRLILGGRLRAFKFDKPSSNPCSATILVGEIGGIISSPCASLTSCLHVKNDIYLIGS